MLDEHSQAIATHTLLPAIFPSAKFRADLTIDFSEVEAGDSDAPAKLMTMAGRIAYLQDEPVVPGRDLVQAHHPSEATRSRVGIPVQIRDIGPLDVGAGRTQAPVFQERLYADDRCRIRKDPTGDAYVADQDR